MMHIPVVIKKHPKSSLVVLNLFFATLAVVGQVGENVSLPLWSNAASSNCSIYRSATSSGNMDSYFILSFASFSYVVIFGVITLVMFVVRRKSITYDDLTFPQWQFMLIGLCDALNGILIVFAAPPNRTAPFLQAILGNIVIPLTIILRLLILRKKPTILKILAAGFVIVGLVLSLIPVITGMDKDSKSENQDWLDQPTANRILWPLCFMIGFVPATLMNVIEEMSLKDSRKVNMFYLLFWTSLYQLITVMCFFWVDILPQFGFADGIKGFGQNYWFALQCFFGADTCNYVPGLRGSSFIFMYVIAYIGSGLLLRYSEGATYLAIVQALVTPLGALFWSIFSTNNCGNFFAKPHADTLTYFSIGGIVLIVPSILIYNIGTFEELKKLFKKVCRRRNDTYMDGEHSPLLAN